MYPPINEIIIVILGFLMGYSFRAITHTGEINIIINQKDAVITLTISKCKWCGKEYEKEYNNQACCSKECQEKLTAENSAKSSMRHYYKHKIGNTSKKAVTSLGSKGTTSTTKPKENAEDEHEWAVKEAQRIGFNLKKFNGPLAA